MTDGPALRYFRSLVGRWSGAFTFSVTDRTALRAAPFGTRSRLAGASFFGRAFGPSRMATTLDEASERRFLHTTRVTKWGTTLFESVEEISILDDDRSVRMTGELRNWPGRREAVTSEGAVEPSATGAFYRIPWLGVEMIQRTRIVPEGLELTQETPWSRAEVLLRRA